MPPQFALGAVAALQAQRSYVAGLPPLEKIGAGDACPKEHPGCTAADSRKNDLYLKIVSNAMSGSSVDETYKNINKIIGNVSKKVQIDR